jgi:hypothetical protein
VRTRTIFVQLIVWAAALALLNVAIARLTANSLPRQVLRAIARSANVTDLFVGNSVMVAALDRAAFEAARPGTRALNIAVGSTSPVEHDLFVRRALRLAPRRVYYAFFDSQLTRPLPSRWKDLSGTRAMVYYVDRERAIRLMGRDGPPAWQVRLTSWLPMVVERATLWAVVERTRRRLAGFGAAAQEVGRFGRTADFAGLEDDPDVFRQYCADVVAHRTPLLTAVQDLFESVRHAGAELIVIEAPMTSSHRRRFYDTPEWEAYRAHVRSETERFGGRFVDASDWMSDAAFEDAVHLSTEGAAAFTTKLGRATE